MTDKNSGLIFKIVIALAVLILFSNGSSGEINYSQNSTDADSNVDSSDNYGSSPSTYEAVQSQDSTS